MTSSHNMEEQFQESDASEPQLESLSTEELEAFQKVNGETISKLKADIELLKWKLRQFGPEAHLGPVYKSLRRGGPGALESVKEKLQKEIDQCANALTETIKLTEVTVDAFERRVTLLDDDHCVKEFDIEGIVYNRRVRLSCTVDEQFSSEGVSPLEGKVTWFQIQFQEDIHNAIGGDVLKAAEKIAIYSAFSLLKSYLKWKKERDENVVALTTSNPDKVSLFTSEDGIYCLKITNPKVNCPVFTIEWGRRTEEGRIVLDIHLKVEAPEKWIAMDTKNVLESAPEIFEEMMTTLGLEKSLEALVQLLATVGSQTQASPNADSQREAVS